MNEELSWKHKYF